MSRTHPPGSQAPPICQVDDCTADLLCGKDYHRRQRVCEVHSKASYATVSGETQRFCQQCSKFHLLSEFDDGKRSCRKRLAAHNRRRRRPRPGEETSSVSTGDLKTCMDETSTQVRRKKSKSGCESSASLEGTDGMSGSGGRGLQLHTIGALEHLPQAEGLSSAASSVSGTDAYGFLSSTSMTAPRPLYLSILVGNSQETSAYEHFLQGLGRRAASSSLVVSLGGGLEVGNRAQRSNSSVVTQNHNGMWSRNMPIGSRPIMNVDSLLEKRGPGSDQQIAYSCTNSGGVGNPEQRSSSVQKANTGSPPPAREEWTQIRSAD